jgi:hypothetical protein
VRGFDRDGEGREVSKMVYGSGEVRKEGLMIFFFNY